MRDLKVVVVVVAGVNTLVALVVRNGVEHILVCDSVVVAVCDFAVEPEIGLLGLAEILELLEELGVDNVRRVKAQSVDAELVDPHFNGAEKVVDNLVVSQIELYEVVVTCPALVPEGVAVAASSVEVEVLEPAAVARIPLFLLNVVEGEELSAYVVKYAVEDNSDSVGVKGIADLWQLEVMVLFMMC